MLRCAVILVICIEFLFMCYYAAIGSNIEVLHHNSSGFIAVRMIFLIVSGFLVLKYRSPYLIIISCMVVTFILSYEFICIETDGDLYVCNNCKIWSDNILRGNIQEVLIFFLIPNFFIFQLIGKQIDILRLRMDFRDGGDVH